MDYPFYYKGKQRGILTLTRSGIYTALRIEADGIDEKILRVSVFGEGRECSLGVAESRDGHMLFEKKLSRNSMKELPRIEYAAESNGRIDAPAEKQNAADKTENGGLVWKKRADGSLIANDGVSDIIALPAEIRTCTAKCRIKIIEGRGYMLFRY